MRVGIGWDVHRLVKGRKLVLGGLQIPFPLGLEGHSDADVLVHAVIDSILGALGQGDIGQQFPDTDPKYRNIPSTMLLGKIHDKLKRMKYDVLNIDSTIIAEKPRLASYTLIMSRNIAKVLNIPMAHVNVKVKTEEKLGYVGQGKAIAAQAVCLITKKS